MTGFLLLGLGGLRQLSGGVAHGGRRLCHAPRSCFGFTEQLGKAIEHEVEGVGKITKHVSCHRAAAGEISFTHFADHDQEFHQPALKDVAFILRLHQRGDPV